MVLKKIFASCGLDESSLIALEGLKLPVICGDLEVSPDVWFPPPVTTIQPQFSLFWQIVIIEDIQNSFKMLFLIEWIFLN